MKNSAGPISRYSQTWNASSEIITPVTSGMICMTFVPSKNPRKQDHVYKLQQTVNSEQSETPALAYWTTGSKSPRTSTMATLVPRASLLGTRLLCNNNNHKMHHARGACWFTIATSRSIAMTPFSSLGRTVSQKGLQLSTQWVQRSYKFQGSSPERYVIHFLGKRFRDEGGGGVTRF